VSGESLSVLVSMSVSWNAAYNSKMSRPISVNFLCTLPIATAGSSSDGIALRYVLPVFLDDVIYFHTMGPMARIEEDVMFRGSSPGGGTSRMPDNYSVRSS